MIDLERYIRINADEIDTKVPPIRNDNISIIIPTLTRKEKLINFIRSILNTHIEAKYPKEIIIVDNNINDSKILELPFNHFPITIKIVKCLRGGAACARNEGASIAKGEWLLFCDDDCVATDSLIEGYIKGQNSAIAYAGKVISFGKDRYSKYYDQQEILLAPNAKYKNMRKIPMYFVTANAMVLKEAFIKVNGFNESFKYAAEDVDLSLRLWQIGKLDFAFKSIILHHFENNWKDFKKRFFNYGMGNKQLEKIYNVTKKPKKVEIKKKTIFNYYAAQIQHKYMLKGYNSIQ